jgi:hypothetical protein
VRYSNLKLFKSLKKKRFAIDRIPIFQIQQLPQFLGMTLIKANEHSTAIHSGMGSVGEGSELSSV